KCPDSRPPPGQRRGWRLFGRIHGASRPPARCGHCSDRQRGGLDQRPVVVSVQSSVHRYLLIAGGLLLRAQQACGYAAAATPSRRSSPQGEATRAPQSPRIAEPTATGFGEQPPRSPSTLLLFL